MENSHNNKPWLIVRHVEYEHLGTLARIFDVAGMKYHYLDVFRGEQVPHSIEDYSGLIIMGGPMGVYEADRYPFILEEQHLVRNAIKENRPVLGICLGSQIIASALGARVYPGHVKEIGWFPVDVVENDKLTNGLPRCFMAFHWHGDTFDLPQGAVRLFQSNLYKNQGFRWGPQVLAIQFHFEVSLEMIDEWLNDEGCCTEIAALPNIKPDEIRQQTTDYGKPLEELSEIIFKRFITNANRK